MSRPLGSTAASASAVFPKRFGICRQSLTESKGRPISCKEQRWWNLKGEPKSVTRGLRDRTNVRNRNDNNIHALEKKTRQIARIRSECFVVVDPLLIGRWLF